LSLTYIDTNILVYAFLKPKRKLQPHETSIKEAAKKIISRINEGEKVATSVVHFSEVCNILEDHLPFEEALSLEKGLLLRENISILEVSEQDYMNAISVAENYKMGMNDALACVIMGKAEMTKIYSFDKDFDSFPDIKRITQ
jgi:predicted nucleic acid-binding protein